MELYDLGSSTGPLKKIHSWIQEAKNAGAALPHAMNLASVDSDGTPSSRMVLLKSLSNKGLVFFTDYESKKGQEINGNKRVAVNFWWARTDKQIRIEGLCYKVSKRESDEYFQLRPRGSQISALTSKQSKVIKTYNSLVNKAKKIELKYDGEKLKRPSRWGGFLLQPNRIEFWTNHTNRLHKREEYFLENNDNFQGKTWKKVILSP